MFIITSCQEGAFNETICQLNSNVLNAKESFLTTSKDDKKAYYQASLAATNTLAYAFGFYKAAIDSAPDAIRADLNSLELDHAIKRFISLMISVSKEDSLASTLFENTFHSEDEVYIQFLDYANRFNKGCSTFFQQLFHQADTAVLQFALGYITAIKLLCGLNGFAYQNVPSEENLVCKNWKYFFSEDSTFSIAGTFVLPQNAMTLLGSSLKEELNVDVYENLRKRPLEDFNIRLNVISLFTS